MAGFEQKLSFLHRPSKGRFVPNAAEPAPRQRRGADRSNLGIFGEGQCVFHVDPKVAYCVLDLAMTEKDLDSAQVACGPIDYRRLRSPKRMGAILASHQADRRNPIIHKPGILARAEMLSMIDAARKDKVVDRTASAFEPVSKLARASASNSN